MSKTILLADDSVTIRKVVELTFMDEAYDLVSVGSGTEALDRTSDAIDLVIADVHMPGADGYEVCEKVKEKFPDMPVLLLVGTFESFDENRAEKVGADEHLKKPFDSQDLLTKVRNLVGASSEPDVAAQEDQGEVEPEAAAEEPTIEAPAAPAATAVAAAVAPDSLSPSAAPSGNGGGDLSPESVDRIARRVVELLSEDAIREVAWEVIPDLAEVVIKERLNELEGQVE